MILLGASGRSCCKGESYVFLENVFIAMELSGAGYYTTLHVSVMLPYSMFYVRKERFWAPLVRDKNLYYMKLPGQENNNKQHFFVVQKNGLSDRGTSSFNEIMT